jgi:hypothetical protein
MYVLHARSAHTSQLLSYIAFSTAIFSLWMAVHSMAGALRPKTINGRESKLWHDKLSCFSLKINIFTIHPIQEIKKFCDFCGTCKNRIFFYFKTNVCKIFLSVWVEVAFILKWRDEAELKCFSTVGSRRFQPARKLPCRRRTMRIITRGRNI